MKGYCDIDCLTCDCYIATVKDDNLMRITVAIKWSRMFNKTVLPREINCTGCKSIDTKFSNCTTCKIREHRQSSGVFDKAVNGK